MNKKIKRYAAGLRIDQYFSILFIVVFLLLQKSYQPEGLAQYMEQVTHQVYLASSSAVPVRMALQIPEPNLTASSAAVIDVDSGSILLEKNLNEIYLPASTTKLMSALVVKEKMKLGDTVTVPNLGANEGSKVGLEQGEQYTVENLMKAMLIQSANDAAESLATSYPGGRGEFINRMNTKAQELGLTKTIFENPTGFDGVHHQTTARDLAILSLEAIKDSDIAEIVKNKSEYITDITRNHRIFLQNSHQLIGTDPDIIGIKTGTTDGAGQVLITQINRGGRNLIIVVMGSGDRYTDTLNIINWVYTTHRWLNPS